MKAKISLFIIILVAGLTTKLIAQDKSPFWVIETGPSLKGKTIIRIYDYNQNLIHEEVSAKVLSVTKRRDRKVLDRKLKTVLNQETLASGSVKKR